MRTPLPHRARVDLWRKEGGSQWKRVKGQGHVIVGSRWMAFVHWILGLNGWVDAVWIMLGL